MNVAPLPLCAHRHHLHRLRASWRTLRCVLPLSWGRSWYGILVGATRGGGSSWAGTGAAPPPLCAPAPPTPWRRSEPGNAEIGAVWPALNTPRLLVFLPFRLSIFPSFCLSVFRLSVVLSFCRSIFLSLVSCCLFSGLFFRSSFGPGQDGAVGLHRREDYGGGAEAVAHRCPQPPPRTRPPALHQRPRCQGNPIRCCWLLMAANRIESIGNTKPR